MCDIVNRINKENIKKFGPICKICTKLEYSCRCESAKEFKKFMESNKTAKEWQN